MVTFSLLVRQKVPRVADDVRTGKAAEVEALAELATGMRGGRDDHRTRAARPDH